ncbi:MAG: hypothetical protein HQK61_10820, partial [Desulfamplus sp.]|nr:hypothetical protein [Desulfamplus sp.]
MIALFCPVAAVHLAEEDGIQFFILATPPAFANDSNSSIPEAGETKKEVGETKKILEQTSLIEKTLEIEAREIEALSAYLEEIQNKKSEFDSSTNVYKIELTTFGSQLHLPEVDTKLIEKAYMSCQTSVGKVTQELSKLVEKREQLKQTQQISYEQKTGNDKFLMELKNDSLLKVIAEKSHDSPQAANKSIAPQLPANQTTQQKNGSDLKQNSVPRDHSGSNDAVRPDKIIKNEPLSPEQQQRLSEQQLNLGRHGDPQQRAALEQKLILEQQLAEQQKVLQEQEGAEEQRVAEKQRLALGQLRTRLKYVQTALTKKMLLTQSIHSIINERIPVLEEIQKKYKTLVGELEIRIRDAKKAELLTRKTNPLTQDTWKRLGEDFKELLSSIRSVFEMEKWANSFSFLWLSGL